MTKEELKEEFENKFIALYNTDQSGMGYDVRDEIADWWLQRFDLYKKELKEKIEELIQKERFSGAPKALNEVLSIIDEK